MYKQRGGLISLQPSPRKRKQDKYAYDKNCLVFGGLFRRLVGYSQQRTAFLELYLFASAGENLVSWPDTETCSHNWVHQSVWPLFHLKKETDALC